MGEWHFHLTTEDRSTSRAYSFEPWGISLHLGNVVIKNNLLWITDQASCSLVSAMILAIIIETDGAYSYLEPDATTTIRLSHTLGEYVLRLVLDRV